MDSSSNESRLRPPWGPGRSQSAPSNPQTDSETSGQLPRPGIFSATASTSALNTIPETNSKEKRNFRARTLRRIADVGQPLSTVWSSKIRDKSQEAAGEDALCSQCLKFPIAEFRSGECELECLKWKTPLERLLRQRSCQFCRLLLRMLSRPQNDPLRVDAVAKHIPHEIQERTLSELAKKDLPFINEHWPFGRTAKRGKESASWTEDFF